MAAQGAVAPLGSWLFVQNGPAPQPLASAVAPEAPALPTDQTQRARVLALAAEAGAVSPDIIAEHAAAGLQPSAAALHEAANGAARGAAPELGSVPDDVHAALVDYVGAADSVLGPDAIEPRPLYELVGTPSMGWSPVHAIKKGLHVVTHPVSSAKGAGKKVLDVAQHPVSSAEHARAIATSDAAAALDAARNAAAGGLEGTYRVGRYIYSRAAHPGRTWDSGVALIDKFPDASRELALKSWKTLHDLATGELAEEAIRMMIRTTLRPLLQAFMLAVKIGAKNAAPEALAIGGAAAIARLAGAGVALDPHKLQVAAELGQIGARHLVHQVLGHLPEPPNVGPIKARDFWRHHVRGPVESGLSKALTAAVVAVATGKEEDVLAAIAGVGALSWGTVAIKKVLDFVVAQGLSIAVGTLAQRGESFVEASLRRIGVGPELSRAAIDALRSPLPIAA